MNDLSDKYDFIGEFHQGVAIVVKDAQYGAILMGGNEVIPPSYDYISIFNEGYAQAIRKGECVLLDLSGRECKLYEGKQIAIPAKYDFVRDFKNGYACVLLNGKWGAIDVNGNEIYEPQFYFLSDFIGGTAKYQKKYSNYVNSWGYLNVDGFCSECNLMEPEIESDGSLIIERDELRVNGSGYVIADRTRHIRINNKGQLLVKNGTVLIALSQKFLIANDFENGFATVQDLTGYWGAVDTNGKIVVPLQYTSIQNFSENKAFARTKDGKMCLISTNGSVIKEFDTYIDAKPFKKGYAIVFDGERKQGLINGNGKELLTPLDGYIYYTDNPHEFEITSTLSEGKHGLFIASTSLLIKPRFKKVLEVKKDCVNVEVDDIGETLIDLSGRAFMEDDGRRIYLPDWCLGVKLLSDNIYLGKSDNGKWGLVDYSGKTLCMPTFDKVGDFIGHLLPTERTETITVNVWSGKTKEVTQYGLYNAESKISIPAKYDVCPKYADGFYKISSKGLVGAINEAGDIVLKPEWKSLNFTSGYYIVSKMIKENYYSEREGFGLADKNGKIIFETKYDEIVVFRKGLYKVRENYAWYLCNDGGRLSEDAYDDIESEGELFPVSKHGLKGRLNEKGKKVIFSDDGHYVELPSKFAWGYDFEDCVAKVLINGRENYVDKSFNIGIKNGKAFILVDQSIDYIVTTDGSDNYIFASGKQFGLIDNTGNILIKATYNHLSPFSTGMYIAAIIKEGDYKKSYGIIDRYENIILDFDYSSINPYEGKVSREAEWSWYNEDVIKQVDSLNEVQFWLIRKDGYGLIDRNGNICIQPEYSDIQKIEDYFLVKNKKYKYGIIASDYTVVCEPQYDTITMIANGLWKVSIITSTYYNNKTEVFGILDAMGNELLAPIYQSIGKMNDDKRAFINLKGLTGLVDENYRIVVEPQYEQVSAFKDGKANVYKRVFKQGMSQATIVRGEIDINGIFTDFSEMIKDQKAVAPQYKYIRSIQENVFAASNGLSVGLIDSKGNTIIPFHYSYIDLAAPNLVRIYKNGRELIGLATTDGKIIFEPSYGKVEVLKDGLVTFNNGHWYDEEEDERPYRKSREFSMGKWGVINMSGEVVLPTIYDSIEAGEGAFILATRTIFIKNKNVPCIQVSGRFNEEGKQIIKNGNGDDIPASPKFDWQEDFDADGHSTVYYQGYVGRVNDKFQLILPSGQKDAPTDFVLPEEYDWGYKSGNGLIITEKNGKKGVIHRTEGRLIADSVYDWIEVLSGDHAVILQCGVQDKSRVTYPPSYSWSLLNMEGMPLIHSSCKEVTNLGHSLLAIKDMNNKYSIIDFSGKRTSDHLFDIVLDFGITSCMSARCNWEKPTIVGELHYAIVGVAGKYGIIDNKGRLIIFPQYTSLTIQGNNRFLADGTLINSSEQKIVVKGESVLMVPGDYKKAELLDNGLMLVSKDKLFGCINRTGTIIIPMKYQSLSYRNNLLVAVEYDEANDVYKRGVINFFGEQVIPFSLQFEKLKIEDHLILYRQDGHWGAYTLQGRIICKPVYDYITYISDDLIKVGLDGTDYKEYTDYYWEDGERYEYADYREYPIKEWGLIDNRGHELLPIKYSDIADKAVDGLIEIRLGKSIGYVETAGHVLLEPTYSSIGDFTDGYAIVSKPLRHEEEQHVYGVINSSFTEIIPCAFRKIEYEKETGLFKTNVGYKTPDGKYIAEVDGEELPVDKKYLYCKPFHDACAIAVRISNNKVRYGLINMRSEDIFPPIFQQLKLLDNGLYKFKMNEKYGLLNTKGEIVVPNKYDGIGKFEDDLSCVVIKIQHDNRNGSNKLYGYINSEGTEILVPSYEFIGKRSESFSVIMKNNSWGLFSIQSHHITMIPGVAFLSPCKEHLCLINKGGTYDKRIKKVIGGRWGYVSTDGQIAIEPVYEQVYHFSDGIAAVKQNSRWGFINIDGTVIVPCEYDEVECRFEKGKGALMKGKMIYVFDKNGSQIDSYEQETYDDYTGYDDDIPSIYDNPYYDDNLDMDQQSIEFWNSL